MTATPISKMSRGKFKKGIKGVSMGWTKLGRCSRAPFRRMVRRCPAVMLAANRTARVRGRMNSLTSSIITRKNMMAAGDPSGTRWANVR